MVERGWGVAARRGRMAQAGRGSEATTGGVLKVRGVAVRAAGGPATTGGLVVRATARVVGRTERTVLAGPCAKLV